MKSPLSGIRVLDLSRILAGPFCTMRLGDMGADVIKIEQPDIGDETRRWGPPFISGESAYFLSINRNKKSVTLDFKSKGGRAILMKLIKSSDVLVENFRVGVMKKLGLDYPTLKKINPRLIYCSISGYGQTSKKSHRQSYDLIIQGESGLMDVTGFPGHPPTKTGVSIADINAGTLAFAGITLALYGRELSGKGTHLDIGLLDATLSLFAFQSQLALSSSVPVTRKGNLHPTLVPYQTFKAKDGYINIAVVNDTVWKSFCTTIRRSDLVSNKRFTTNASRVKNHRALEAILKPIIKSKTRAMWESVFAKADVPIGMINTLHEALKQEKHSVQTIRHPAVGNLPMVGNPLIFSSKQKSMMLPPPLLGEHTSKILRTLGYSQRSITRFRSQNVI